jgi:trimethylamine:corrinoid methyltransferase-like protein
MDFRLRELRVEDYDRWKIALKDIGEEKIFDECLEKAKEAGKIEEEKVIELEKCLIKNTIEKVKTKFKALF